MKYYIVLVFLALSFNSFSQNVNRDGKVYEVKKNKIFLNGENVSKTLNVEERLAILNDAALISENIKLEEKAAKAKAKEAKKLAKAEKKAEKKAAKEARKVAKAKAKEAKKLQKAQKEGKKVKTTLNDSEKLQENYKNADSKFRKAQHRYAKLKEIGALSPPQEAKWLKKIRKLNKKRVKAKKITEKE